MRSDAAIAALRDMDRHIGLAVHFVEDMDFEGFRDDTRTVYAVTRCLEIISEASRRLPNELKMRYPSNRMEGHGRRQERLPSRLRGCRGHAGLGHCSIGLAPIARGSRP
jgi:hypothetical protein